VTAARDAAARAKARTVHARDIVAAAIAAADPGPAVHYALTALDPTTHIHIIAIGKAAATMTRAALSALPDAAAVTMVLPPGDTPRVDRPGVRIVHGAHPLPDESSAPPSMWPLLPVPAWSHSASTRTV
jgi:glycerate-2-kinase